MELKDLQKRIGEISQSHGWRDTKLNIPEELLLLHCEVSEALQEYRTGKPVNNVEWDYQKIEGFPVEIADIIIRCIDLLDRIGIDVEFLVETKNDYNERRPYRHGGKLL